MNQPLRLAVAVSILACVEQPLEPVWVDVGADCMVSGIVTRSGNDASVTMVRNSITTTQIGPNTYRREHGCTPTGRNCFFIGGASRDDDDLINACAA